MSFRVPRPTPAVALLAAVAAALLLAPGRAGAAFIAGNLATNQGLTAGGRFSSGSGFNVTGAQTAAGRGYAIAVRFTVGPTSMAFDTAQLGLVYRAGVNALDLALVADAGGLPLGATLETIRLAGLSPVASLVTATSVARPTLAAGMTYWLVATAGSPSTDFGWMANTTGQAGNSAYRADSPGATGSWALGPSLVDASFAVSGSAPLAPAAVGEPPSGLLCGLGLCGLALGHRRTRRRRAAAAR